MCVCGVHARVCVWCVRVHVRVCVVCVHVHVRVRVRARVCGVFVCATQYPFHNMSYLIYT